MEPAGAVATAVFVGVWGAGHSLLASDPAKRLARRVFGNSADRWYRLVYNLFALLTLLPLGSLMSSFPDQPLYSIQGGWFVAMEAGRALSALGLIYALFSTGLADLSGLRQVGWLPGHSGETEAGLVTGGLYSWVRHPVYLFSLGLVWLEPRMTVMRLTLYTALTAYIVIATFFEERRLVHQFGPAYLEYQARVPRLLPLPARRRGER